MKLINVKKEKMPSLQEGIKFTLEPAPILFPVEYSTYGAAPSSYIRSALFGIVQKGAEKYVVDKMICCQGEDVRISYTGEELNQTDLTVWLIIKKNCIPHGVGRVELTAIDILKQMDKDYGQSDKRWLKKKLLKLRSSVITVYHGNAFSTANLIRDFDSIDDLNTFHVALDERILSLLCDNKYTLVDMAVRAQIKGDLAKWIYTCFNSHDKIYSYYDYTLKDLCGSTQKDKLEFRKQLKKALKELVEVGYLSKFNMDRKGLITVKH